MMAELWITACAAGMLTATAVFAVLAWRFNKRLESQANEILSRVKGECDVLRARDDQVARDLADLIDQVDLLMKDIEGKLGARIDDLETVFKQADARIAHIRQELAEVIDACHNACAERVAQEGAGQPIWEPAAPVGSYASAEGDDPRPGPIAEEEEIVTLPGSWPLPPKGKSQPAAEAQQPPTSPVPLASARHREVLRLQAQGSQPLDIARKLQMDLGEVELVLNLHHCKDR